MGSRRPAGHRVEGGWRRSAGPAPTCGPGQQPQTRPSAPPPPSLHVALRLLLRGRRRRRRPARRVRARFPPPPRACWPAGPGTQGRPLEPSAARGQSGRGGPLTSRPGVLSASSLPRVRSAASAAAAAASPTSPASRGAAAAPRPPPPAPQLPAPPPASRHRPSAAESTKSVQQAAARPPQPSAHNPPRLRRGGRAAARPGSRRAALTGPGAAPAEPASPKRGLPRVAWLPRASLCRPRKGRNPRGIALQLTPFPPPRSFPSKREGADPSPPPPTN